MIVIISVLWKLVLLFIILRIIKGVIPKYKIAKADRARKDGKYSEAYQIYNSVIVQYSNKYKLPEVKDIPISIDAFSDIGKDAAKKYANYWLKKPSSRTCFTALNWIIEISTYISIFEVYTTVTSEKILSLEEYKSAWKNSLCADQNNLPLSVDNELEKMYTSGICLIKLQGDNYSCFDGVFFDPKKNICFQIEKRAGYRSSNLLSMKTGDWVSVVRISRTLSDSINNDFFNARSIQGRWYSQPITLKPNHHLFEISFEISGGPNFPVW